MKLVIFDIDGTIIDSVSTDDECFVATYDSLFNIDLSCENWNDFENVTDSGITKDIFVREWNRLPTKHETTAIKKHYLNLLKDRIHLVKPIKGINAFINQLNRDTEITIAFATGGWEETALLKSTASNIDITNFVYKTADDDYRREKIVKYAINECKLVSEVDNFEKIVSIGDGLWDYKTAEKLNLDFIGVDVHNNFELKQAGVQKVINDFRNIDLIVNMIG